MGTLFFVVFEPCLQDTQIRQLLYIPVITAKEQGKNSIVKRYRLHRMFDEPVALLLFRGEDDKL